jgi:hypothetical protein
MAKGTTRRRVRGAGQAAGAASLSLGRRPGRMRAAVPVAVRLLLYARNERGAGLGERARSADGGTRPRGGAHGQGPGRRPRRLGQPAGKGAAELGAGGRPRPQLMAEAGPAVGRETRSGSALREETLGGDAPRGAGARCSGGGGEGPWGPGCKGLREGRGMARRGGKRSWPMEEREGGARGGRRLQGQCGVFMCLSLSQTTKMIILMRAVSSGKQSQNLKWY